MVGTNVPFAFSYECGSAEDGQSTSGLYVTCGIKSAHHTDVAEIPCDHVMDIPPGNVDPDRAHHDRRSTSLYNYQVGRGFPDPLERMDKLFPKADSRKHAAASFTLLSLPRNAARPCRPVSNTDHTTFLSPSAVLPDARIQLSNS
jgi:hypothetical protein